jgi:hypothetical protein
METESLGALTSAPALYSRGPGSNQQFCHSRLNVVVECAAFLLHISEVPGSNFGPENDYSELFLYYSVSPGKFRDITSN